MQMELCVEMDIVTAAIFLRSELQDLGVGKLKLVSEAVG